MPINLQIKQKLFLNSKTWLITGVAGFIGSNLLEELLRLNQRVIGIDNFSSGSDANLIEVKDSVTEDQWLNFNFIEGTILNYDTCLQACQNVNYVLHQAATSSVEKSLADPIASNEVNVVGFLNILAASKNMGVNNFVYASSCAVYGDNISLPVKEEYIGSPLSPYALTKQIDERYASLFKEIYNFNSIGLRYFNIFGKRQNLDGDYSAVIPKWIDRIINDQKIFVYGDNQISRDFCHVDNVVQANILAAVTDNKNALNKSYNIGSGARTSLKKLYELIQSSLNIKHEKVYIKNPRKGDIQHSQADISNAKRLLNYEPNNNLTNDLLKTVKWYLKKNI